MCNFYVGQRVVCVDARPSPTATRDLDGLTEGKIYTIRFAGPDEDNGRPVVRLHEIVRRKEAFWRSEQGFAPTRFRPLTDISVFEKLLTGAPIETQESIDA